MSFGAAHRARPKVQLQKQFCEKIRYGSIFCSRREQTYIEQGKLKGICEKIGRLKQKTEYHMHAIISRSLYIVYPIFDCGLYCRAVSITEKEILQFWGLKSAFHNQEWFQIKRGL